MSIEDEYGKTLQDCIDKAEIAACNDPFNTFFVVEIDSGEGKTLSICSERRATGVPWWHSDEIQNFDPFIVYETR